MTSAEIADLKQFTVDELGKVHLRLDGIERRSQDFEALVAQHFTAVYGRLDALERRMDTLEQRMDDFERRLTRVEIIQEQMRDDFRAFGEALVSISRTLEEFRDEMRGRFDALEARVIRLEAA